MVPMTLTIMSVRRRADTVHARLHVCVPDIDADAAITMRFVAPPESTANDWRELAYDRALMMLDPA